MKLASFSVKNDHQKRIGIVTDQGIVDLSDKLDGDIHSMQALISAWDTVRVIAEERMRNPSQTWPQSDCVFHAPIERPGKILAIGLNYLDHIREVGLAQPKEQLWFAKASTSVNGPFDPIELPIASQQVDYEAELVVVIGRRVKHATPEEARTCIFGFCVGNDVSVRDWQMRTPQWYLGKSFDTHAPIGPWIVTSDEIADPHRLNIRCLVNGEIRQSSNTSNLVFNVYEQIVHLSQVMTLEPGDLLFTGTPAGVGFGYEPKLWLQTGDHVRIEVDGIGAIEARMEPEKRKSLSPF